MAHKHIACVHVFSDFHTIELLLMDVQTGGIVRSASTTGSFDASTRQIADIDQLTTAIEELYEKNRVPLSTPTVLVLPSIYTRETKLPESLSSRSDLTLAFNSEAERFYLFKKQAPAVAWLHLSEASDTSINSFSAMSTGLVDSRPGNRYLYAAQFNDDINLWTNLFKGLKIPITQLDINYTSVLRALSTTGSIDEELQTHGSWCLLMVNESSFFACRCSGLTIDSFIETPISVSLGDMDATISEIQQDFDRFMGMNLMSKLVLVNNNKSLPSQNLIERLNMAGAIIHIDQNSSTLKSCGASEGFLPCSLEALGGALLHKFPDLPNLNFLPETMGNQSQLEEVRKKLCYAFLGIAGVIFFVGLSIAGFVNLYTTSQQGELTHLNNLANEVQINPKRLKAIMLNKFTLALLNQNAKANNILTQVGLKQNSSIWLKRVVLQRASKEQKTPWVFIEGQSIDSAQINEYKDDLGEKLNELTQTTVSLDLGTITPQNSAEGQSYYDWSLLPSNKKIPDSLNKDIDTKLGQNTFTNKVSTTH